LPTDESERSGDEKRGGRCDDREHQPEVVREVRGVDERSGDPAGDLP
jgi:hypothetical protein